MLKQGISDYVSSASIFHMFNIDRERVLSNLSDLARVMK